MPDNLAPGGYPLGMIPSPADRRDYPYPAFGTMFDAGDLPEEYVGEYLPAVRDQGATASCVAHALAMLREVQEYHELKAKVKVSREFIYHHRPNKLYHQDRGMIPREALAVALDVGTPPEEYWPGITEVGKETRPEPFDPVLQAAQPYRIGAYASVNHRLLPEMQSAIKARHGVLIGVPVHSNFIPDSEGNIPPPKGSLIGYHMMASLYWLKGKYVVPNSYGSKWGGIVLPDGRQAPGYCYIPFDFPLVENWTVLDKPTEKVTEIWVIEGEPIIFVNGHEQPPVDLAPFLQKVPGGDRFCGAWRHMIEALGGEITGWGTYESNHSRWPGKMWFKGRLVNQPWPRRQ